MTADDILAAVRGWPVAARLDLVDRLWDQMPDDAPVPPPSPDLLAELHRRIAAYQADPENVFTWDQVVASIRRGHR